jgi:hypothetical protein
MRDFNKVRAGLSCLPLVGPFIAMYNALEVKGELSLSSPLDQLSLTAASLSRLAGTLSPLSGNTEGVDKANEPLESCQHELTKRLLSVSQKGRLYSICGIVGSVLSVATEVGLIALGILTVVPGVVAAAYFTFQVAVLSYNLYRHNKNIQIYQRQI